MKALLTDSVEPQPTKLHDLKKGDYAIVSGAYTPKDIIRVVDVKEIWAFSLTDPRTCYYSVGGVNYSVEKIKPGTTLTITE